MNLLFKTLQHQSFSMEVDMAGTVDDLIWELENHLGQENLYKVISAGKLMKEEEKLSEYNISNKIPLIVMVTKPRDIQMSKVNSNYVENTEADQSEVSKTDTEVFKRTRTVTEDSGIEEDISPGGFLTDNEFRNVIEVIKTCDYLKCKNDQPVLNIEEIELEFRKYCTEENIKNDAFDDAIFDKEQEILEAKLNKSQLQALFEDVQSIFDEAREAPKDVSQFIHSELSDESDEESDSEEDLKKRRLLDMGFTDKEAEDALKASNNNLQEAVESLIPSIEYEKKPSDNPITNKSNPLAFLRDIDEFQFLRYLVLQDPSQLQPLLLSFGQSHPDIMKIINKNKDIFISMIHEQTGAKTSGRH